MMIRRTETAFMTENCSWKKKIPIKEISTIPIPDQTAYAMETLIYFKVKVRKQRLPI